MTGIAALPKQARSCTRWSQPTLPLALPDDEVHVWCAWLDQPTPLRERLAYVLSPDETARAQRCHASRDRNRFMVGRGVLRSILGRYLEVLPEHIRFRYGAHGKPELDDVSASLSFNLSHTEGLALYVCARRPRVGIDVERIRAVPDWEDIARQFFAAEECVSLQSLTPQERPLGFFSIWTGKEAYLKATGQGLSQPLDQTVVKPACGQEQPRMLRLASHPTAHLRWSLRAVATPPGYVGALAVEASDIHLKYLCWPHSPLQ